MLSNFKEEMDKYKKEVKDRDIYEFTMTIQQLLKQSDIFKQLPNEEYNIDKYCVRGIEQLADKLYSIDNPNNSIFQLTRSDYCEVKIIKYTMENFDIFWNYIYKLSEFQKRSLTKTAKYYAYCGNLEKDIYTLAKNLYSECAIRLKEEESAKFITGTLTEKEILNIKKRTLNFLKENYSACRKLVIDGRVKIIINGAKFLDKYGYMDHYIDENNLRVRRLNMPYLQTNTRTSKKEKPFTCVSDYFDSDILSSLPDEELSALSLFMINRVEKVKTLITKTLIMITFLSNQTKNTIDNFKWISVNKIPKDEIIEANARYKMLSDYFKEQRHSFNEIAEKDKTDVEFTNNNTISCRSFNLGNGITSDFAKSYNDEYNRFDEDNMLFEDLTRLLHSDNLQIFYEYKDILIDVLLNSVISARININWGISPNDRIGFVDENNQIVLSFDLPGYNAPISCHANLDRVIKTLVDLTNNTIIPLYLGSEQLIYEDNYTYKYYSTYIPFKLSKEQKEALRNASVDSQNSIVKHIAMMQNVLSVAKLKREENRFVDLLSFTEETKVNPSVKSYK